MTKSNLFLVAGVLACGSVQALTLSSPAFEEGATIPDVFTFNLGGQCNGANQSPPLVFSQVPQGTRSLALTMVDPDGGNWLHWKVWNLGGSVTALAPNASASQALEQGRNDFGTQGYGGPCPPTPNHRYVLPCMP
jgi:Raf kinase inhibitor-like YbhB/YbcL family protein